MSIPLGFLLNDVRESAWYRDPAVNWDDTTSPSRAAYLRDGEAHHLVLKPGETPTRIVFRSLTADERAVIDSLTTSVEPGTNGVDAKVTSLWSLRLLWCFAVGCDLPGLPEAIPLTGGGTMPRHERIHGLSRLSRALVNNLVRLYGEEIYQFYGVLVLRGSRATEDDFLPSSPGSTTTNSEGSTAGSAPTGSSSSGSAPTLASVPLEGSCR